MESANAGRGRLVIVAQYAFAVLLIALGVPLLLFGAVIALRAGTPSQESWYETVPLIPLVPAVLALGSASWLIRDARGRREGLSQSQRRMRERLRD
jgi:hypothetical protein